MVTEFTYLINSVVAEPQGLTVLKSKPGIELTPESIPSTLYLHTLFLQRYTHFILAFQFCIL